jgi:hypothetical protein
MEQKTRMFKDNKSYRKVTRHACVKYHTSCMYKTWSLTLRKENGLRVFENRELRRIFGLKREEVAGGWRRLAQ